MDKNMKRSDFESVPMRVCNLGLQGDASAISGQAAVIFGLPTGPVCAFATLEFSECISFVKVNELRDSKNNCAEAFRNEICMAVSERMHEIAKLAREVKLRP